MGIVTTKLISTILKAMLGNNTTNLHRAKMLKTCGMKTPADFQGTADA
jgi:hypothetical protein